MDAILHIIGVCGDTHSHFDLLDIILYGSIASPMVVYVKFRIKNIIIYIKGNHEKKN